MRTSNLIAVIGAGPKGIAVAVKAKVLAEFGFPVDRVVLIEKNGVAANWSGDFGYTNGEMKLGTAPEKDVVFPIETDVGDARLNHRIHERLMDFTWSAFLIKSGRFATWIDRGRPAPCHSLWATYLRWVSEQLSPQVEILQGEVFRIDLSEDGQRWLINLRDSSHELSTIEAESLMLTGPGKTRLDFSSEFGALPKNVYDLETFWSSIKEKKFPKNGRLAIVGAGENAASALLALKKYAAEIEINVISPKGFVSTRAENFYENQFYSQPDENGWSDLSFHDRINFIERTDLGVFSAHAMQILNEETRHQVIPGRLIEFCPESSEQALIKIAYQNRVHYLAYDYVILATGFDQVLSIKSFFSALALERLQQLVDGELETKKLSPLIGKDLSVEGLEPRLHLPMLAGLQQGPGFANLSCLGLLSDRVTLPSALAASSVEENLMTTRFVHE